MNGHQFLHLLGKVRDAAAGGKEAWSVQSTGEKVAVALALSRFDWLQSMGYTVPEAIDRAGPEWVSMIPEIEKIVLGEAAGASAANREKVSRESN